MTDHPHRYLIELTTWATSVRWIEAESADDAIEQAIDAYEQQGDEPYSIQSGGSDFTVLRQETDDG